MTKEKKDKKKTLIIDDLAEESKAIPAMAMAAFDQVVERANELSKQPDPPAAAPPEAAGEQVEEKAAEVAKPEEAAPEAPVAQQEAPAVAEAKAAIAEVEAAQVELPADAKPDTVHAEGVSAPGADVALATEGPTDDTRAPLDLKKKLKPAVVREAKPKVVKPPFDWKAKVFDPLSKWATKALDATGYGLKKTAEGLYFILCIGVYIVINTPGALLYAIGWCAKAAVTAVKNGYDQKPLTLVDLSDTLRKHADPLAIVTAA